MQCGANDQHKDYLRIDYSFYPAKAHIYQNKVLIKKWSVKEPTDLIHQVIDGMDCGGFEKLKIKKTLETVLSIMEPASIRIVSKEE